MVQSRYKALKYLVILLLTIESTVLLVPRNFSRGRGVTPFLAERRGGAVLAADVSVGTTSLECSVLKCGQVYSTLCCLLVGTSHSDCITYCTVTVFLIMSCIVHIVIVIGVMLWRQCFPLGE
jgi:hypothetical protein